ncbi:hypothetical protein ACT8ZV_01255 [Nocardioides sp. MAHUQ-72]|uniref:hypothetical protein n=1 Tax=unclassified Nocardioides TaxID=2615069 RepID=UPI00361252EC
MTARALLVSVTVASALALAGCTGGSPEPQGPPGGSARARPPVELSGPPQPFPAERAALPAGWSRSTCTDLRARGNSGLAVRLALPPGFVPTESRGRSCSFSPGPFTRVLTVSFGRGPTLRSVKERDVDPYTAPGQGDGQLGEVVYAEDVPVFGGHRGEQLDYFCYCDGQNLQERTALARGVRLAWTTPHGRSTREGDYARVTASVSLVHTRVRTCAGHGRTAVFRAPIPQTESIDSFGGLCWIYLQPGRGSLQRRAEVVPAPRRTLAQLADTLRRKHRHVHGVRLEQGVARLDGRPADRLTWLFTRERAATYGGPAGTWRLVTVSTPDLQVTWGGTPRQWRQEAADVRRFVGSVHLLPR